MEQELDYVLIIKAKQLVNKSPETYAYTDNGLEVVFRTIEENDIGNVSISGVVFRRFIDGPVNGVTPEFQGYRNKVFVSHVEYEWNKMRGNTYDQRQ